VAARARGQQAERLSRLVGDVFADEADKSQLNVG
jgi:hypothetical protein